MSRELPQTDVAANTEEDEYSRAHDREGDRVLDRLEEIQSALGIVDGQAILTLINTKG